MAPTGNRIRLARLALRGYKSIRELENFEPRDLNVLIGANGVGKSNLLSFFRMLSFIFSKTGGALGSFVGQSGNAHRLLFDGPEVTPALAVNLDFEGRQGRYEYNFELTYSAADNLTYDSEKFRHTPVGDETERAPWAELGSGHREPRLEVAASGSGTARLLVQFLRRIKVFQFHNTSFTSRFRQTAKLTERNYLREDGGNLAAFLLNMRESFPEHYLRLVRNIGLVLPFFADFELEPEGDYILLRWKENGSDEIFDASQASDGTLRLWALLALLLQPADRLPDIIFLDEPELGLHPQAIGLVGGLVQEAATRVQIFIATQSPALLDHFEPRDIVVVDRKGRESTFRRLESHELDQWLESYSLSELWEKNIFGGRPS